MAKIPKPRRRREREKLGSPADPRSWESLIPAYLEWRAIRNFAASGQHSIESILRLFGSYCCQRGLESPTQVTREVLERYQRHLFLSRHERGDKALSVRTQTVRLSAVKVFYRWLVKARYLAVDPAAPLELPKDPVRLPVDGFRPDEVEAIFAVPDVKTALGIRNRAILEVLYSTGVRRAELASLEFYDVDFGRGVLTVRQGKGGKDRVIPIGERALAWLQKYLADVRPDLAIDPQETALFVAEAGSRFHKDGLGLLVARQIERSGVRKRPGACHLFRHTMATQMLSNGADIRYIQEMLGHAKLETTQLYTRVSIEKLKAIHTATHPAAQLRSSGPGLDGPEGPVLPAEAVEVDELLGRLELEASEDPDELAPPLKQRAYQRKS
jgi:integrase/recombinase XerD